MDTQTVHMPFKMTFSDQLVKSNVRSEVLASFANLSSRCPFLSMQWH